MSCTAASESLSAAASLPNGLRSCSPGDEPGRGRDAPAATCMAARTRPRRKRLIECRQPTAESLSASTASASGRSCEPTAASGRHQRITVPRTSPATPARKTAASSTMSKASISERSPPPSVSASPPSTPSSALSCQTIDSYAAATLSAPEGSSARLSSSCWPPSNPERGASGLPPEVVARSIASPMPEVFASTSSRNRRSRPLASAAGRDRTAASHRPAASSQSSPEVSSRLSSRRVAQCTSRPIAPSTSPSSSSASTASAWLRVDVNAATSRRQKPGAGTSPPLARRRSSAAMTSWVESKTSRPERCGTPDTSSVAWRSHHSASRSSAPEALAESVRSPVSAVTRQILAYPSRIESVIETRSSTRGSGRLSPPGSCSGNWPPRPRMLHGSMVAPHPTARKSRSVASSSSSIAAFASIVACRLAATTRLITRESILADAAGTMPAIRSAPSALPSRASTLASATLSTCLARRDASSELMWRRTPPNGCRNRRTSSSSLVRWPSGSCVMSQR